MSYGNHNLMLVSGFVNGGLNDSWASRLSFQGRKHDGYAEDVLHHRDVEDLESYQGRLQFLYGPTARSSRVASRSITTTTRPTVSTRLPWPAARPRARPPTCAPTARARGATCVRIFGLSGSAQRRCAEHPVCGSAAHPQFMKRDGFGVTLDLQYEASGFTFNSLTGYKDGEGQQVYDQTGRPEGRLEYRATCSVLPSSTPRTARVRRLPTTVSSCSRNPSARTRTFSSSARNSGSRPTIRTAARLDRWACT